MGPDNLVGDPCKVVFNVQNQETIAWLENRFGAQIMFFDAETSRLLSIYQAKGFELYGALSYVAFTDSPDPGYYWGEAAVVAIDPHYSLPLTTFWTYVRFQLADAIRPELNLSENAVSRIIEEHGRWHPNGTVPFPELPKGSAYVKKSMSLSEKAIEQGRKKKFGCYIVSWAFIIGVLFAIVYGLMSCGVL